MRDLSSLVQGKEEVPEEAEKGADDKEGAGSEERGRKRKAAIGRSAARERAPEEEAHRDIAEDL